MSSFTLDDAYYSIDRAGIRKDDIAECVAAWGDNSDGWASWTGGFLFRMKDNTFAYLTGWCDTTGWGCQDGASVFTHERRPSIDVLRSQSGDATERELARMEWDEAPADINRWLRGEINHWEEENL